MVRRCGGSTYRSGFRACAPAAAIKRRSLVGGGLDDVDKAEPVKDSRLIVVAIFKSLATTTLR